MNTRQKRGAVLVTGTSTGIGRTTALHLDRQGFNVFATVRNEGDAQALCSEASDRLVPVLMDVADQDSIERAKEQVTRIVGHAGLAGLVNNAGIGFISPLEFFPMDEVRRIFEINVFGLLAVTQAFLPLLRQNRGRIVNISSTASIFVMPFHGPYSASKMAINGISNALRRELKPLGVQVSMVVCGSISTPIWEKAKALSNRALGELSTEAMEIYAEHYRKVHEFFFKMGEAGVPPEEVARKIAHALTAKRARHTYYVGPDATFYKIADRFVYGRLRDWAVSRSIG